MQPVMRNPMSQKGTYFEELCRRLEFSIGGDDRDALIQCLADYLDERVVRKENEIQIGSTTIKIGANDLTRHAPLLALMPKPTGN